MLFCSAVSSIRERERCPERSQLHSQLYKSPQHVQTVANRPITPPDTPGLMKKARDNGITGQINDPLMKSPTKQAKTARPTYVFHHAVALTFPLAQPPRQAQLGRGRVRKGGRKMTLPGPLPAQSPLSDFWPNKSICCHTVPLRPPLTPHTHPPVLREQQRPRAAEAAHLVAHSYCATGFGSFSIHLCVSGTNAGTLCD